jgi:ADP-heptose:LPS heptosyltransferase
MKEILIINLTRMGDLLQTTPVMSGLKKKYPESNITLLVNAEFAGICSSIPFIDKLIVFDIKDYRRRLLDSQHSLVENYRILEGLLNQINGKEYDLLLNVTHSGISAVLTSLIKAREIRGFTIDPEAHRVIKHPWMRYFFNIIPNRSYNPFHLVDMYLKIGEVEPDGIGLYFTLTSENEDDAHHYLRKEGIQGDAVLVGMNLGASKGEKMWPVKSYAELAEMINEIYGAKIILFGTESEQGLAQEFINCSNADFLNLVGKTSIEELAALLKQCSLFISNDTGPLHVATSVGTKVIDISTAYVYHMETGPYGDGHYVVQADLPCSPCGFDVRCNNMVCKSILTPQRVFDVVKLALNSELHDFDPQSPEWKDIQVYKSYFEEDGYLEFHPLVRKPLSKEALYRLFYRKIWNMGLAPENGKTNKLYEIMSDRIISCWSMVGASEVINLLKNELSVLEKLAGSARNGMTLTEEIAHEAKKNIINVKRIKIIWGRVEMIEKEIELIGNANPCFRPYLTIHKYSNETLEGNDLEKLALDSKIIYETLHSHTCNMLQIMKMVIPHLESHCREQSFCQASSGH